VRRIDAVSGLLAPLDAPPEAKTLDEVFVAGTEPVDEAVPAALPPGDVLLDLYGAGEGGETPASADSDGDAPSAPTEPAPAEPAAPAERAPVEPKPPGRGNARELPSIAD
jgi:hypothetical protein